MILRCTRKLLVVIGSPVADPAPTRDPEDWYANLLWFDRRKCLLLTHAATLFTIFEADVTASSLRATRQLVTGLIGRELRREDLPAATFGDLERQEVLLAKTADRSVLGCMNDMTFRCEHVIAEAQGLAGTDLDELNRSLRRNINSARGYRPPIELTAGRLALLGSRHLGQDGRVQQGLGHAAAPTLSIRNSARAASAAFRRLAGDGDVPVDGGRVAERGEHGGGQVGAEDGESVRQVAADR